MNNESQLKLVPVLDFLACLVEESAYSPPEGTGQEMPISWNVYWQQRLGEAGFSGLTPLGQGCDIPVVNLTDPALLNRYLAREVFDPLEDGYAPDYIGPLRGGYVLRLGQEILVYPGCCGDLTNLAEWKKASAYRGDQWYEVGIGHPLISVRWRRDRLVLSATHPPGIAPDQEAQVLDAEALLAAVIEAEQEVAGFRARLMPILPEFVSPELIEEAAEILLSGHSIS